MAVQRGITLAIIPKAGDPPRKITKVVPFAQGGFAVLTPYHAERQGYVAKIPVNYKAAGTEFIPQAEIKGFSVGERVKLSYHPDGFAQFSGEAQGRIISGRDRKTGEPKGIGLMTNPLDNPIRSGPTFGVTLWGIEDFDELKSNRADTSIVFGEEDMYYRNCTPETANGWIIEVLAFPIRFWNAVRKKGNRYVISMSFGMFEASGAVIELRVIPLPQQNVFLAGFASRAGLKFKSPSGWTINGPGQMDQTGRGQVLMAFYPDPVGKREDAEKLDFVGRL